MNVPSPRTYLINGIILLALLGLTIAAAFVNLGPLNTLAALSISFVKAALIVLFFMHLRYGQSIIWLFAAAGFLWLAIMLSLTLSDYMTRGWL